MKRKTLGILAALLSIASGIGIWLIPHQIALTSVDYFVKIMANLASSLLLLESLAWGFSTRVK